MTENELYTLFDKHRDALTDRKALYSLLNEKFPNETEKISLLLFSFNIGIVGEIQKRALNDRFVARLASKLVASYNIERASAEWSVLTWIHVYGQRILNKQFDSTSFPNDNISSGGASKSKVEKKGSVNGTINKSISSVRSDGEQSDKPNRVDIGSIIKFGTYPQGRNGETAPIEWIVLDNDGTNALVISRYALDCQPFNTTNTSVTWVSCSLRKWLNESFFNNAFSAKEQNLISNAIVKTYNQQLFGRMLVYKTHDKAFLLSISEVKKYFKSNRKRECQPTDYLTVKTSQQLSESNGVIPCWWWLRTPGDDYYNAAGVRSDGSVSDFGRNVVLGDSFVRPALWISLDAIASSSFEASGNASADATEASLRNVDKGALEFLHTDKITVGQYVKFGSYPQSDNSKVLPIEWLVLENDGEKALLVTRFALDCLPYNSVSSGITWGTCSLRKWLNGIFFSYAFSEEEQQKIKSATIAPDKNPYYSTFPGNKTIDKVFLLSATDAFKFFKSDDDRKCVPTDYARVRGAYSGVNYSLNGKATCCWWLRSPGRGPGLAEYVFSDGSVSDNGDDIDESSNCVRPAIWVSIDNAADFSAENTAKDEVAFSEEHVHQSQSADSLLCKTTVVAASNYIKFGLYYQDRNGDEKPIEWIVLKKEGSKALLISRYALSCQRFNTKCTDVTWETCSLRKWLNGTFVNTAFSAIEQKQIISSTIEANRNPLYTTSPGRNTVDKVFLLSITEVNKYFKSGEREGTEEEPYCSPTHFLRLRERGVKGRCCWWTRSPGRDASRVAFVNYDGSVYVHGGDVDSDLICVRPAIWINLKL